MVGLGVDLGDLPEYVGHNDLATAQLLRALAGARLRRAGSCSPRAWSSTARAATRARSTGSSRPAPRRRRRPRRRALRAALPALRPRAGARSTVPEDAPPDPRSVYAATKLAQEHLCAAFGARDRRPGPALRYHNVYGPRMPRDTPYAGVASIFRSALAAGRAPRVFEDGAQRRDFVHVRDVARANVLALTRDRAAPGRVQRRQRHAAHRARDGARRSPAPARRRRGAAPRVTGEWRAGRRAPRRRLARARRRAARLRRRGGLRRRAWPSSPPPRCGPDSARRRPVAERPPDLPLVPDGSAIRPSRQPCSSATGARSVAPAASARAATASGSSTCRSTRPVAPPASGSSRSRPFAFETQKRASPTASWATRSSPSPTWCSTVAPNASA